MEQLLIFFNPLALELTECNLENTGIYNVFMQILYTRKMQKPKENLQTGPHKSGENCLTNLLCWCEIQHAVWCQRHTIM